ncbi:YncE family protein [Salinicola rhizosphaerae]|uniref:YncE family protein n=1 Tax=Salinicola rhizosphaerae TaxID=1443141 RepID=A0ABQ3EAN3_9GAMM|nr:YncE family protein [Salinicola rhizosphaerae]GHB28754.1 hypothetical protein GCM10009038_29590 [Salinicola rhizosphaerae]
MHELNSYNGSLRGAAKRWVGLSLLAVSIGMTHQALASGPANQTHPFVAQRTQVAGSVYEIAFDPQNHRLYAATVSNHVVAADGSAHDTPAGIVVLDADTLEVVKRIDTGNVSPFGLALNPKTQKLYATDTRSGTVAVFDIASGERTALIHAPEGQADHVRQPVVDPTTNTIYVSVVGGFAKGDAPVRNSTIWVIDGSDDSLTDVIDNPVKVATGLALDPQTRRLYVADLANSQIAELDADSHEVLRRLPAAPQSQIEKQSTEGIMGGVGTVNVEIDHDRGVLYAVNQKAGGIGVIDLDSGEVIDDIATGEGALSARLNPHDGNLYVANRGDGSVAVIDGDTRHVSAYLAAGSHPQTVAIDAEDGDVYVSNKAKGRGRHAPDDVPTPFEPDGNTVIRIAP